MLGVVADHLDRFTGPGEVKLAGERNGYCRVHMETPSTPLTRQEQF